MLAIFFVAYGTVLVAELLGDKSLFAIGALATRLRGAHVAAGVTLAFAAKMAVAVIAGRALASISPAIVAAVSSFTFLAAAVMLWLKRPIDGGGVEVAGERWPKATALSFSAIFFTEWADAGQLAAGALAARFGHPVTIWTAATAAVMTKAAAAGFAGVALRRRFSFAHLRYVAVASCLVMSVLAAVRID
jgi:putative Ca2+/H+ antiporter (TMEM165/GDT1 family)